MANNTKRGNNRNKIIGICCAVVVVILLIIAIVAAIFANMGYNDAYFQSDDSKYVLTIDNMEEIGEDEEVDPSMPLKTHYVYYYDGDNITEVKLFSEFGDADAAQTAYDDLLASEEGVEENYKSIETNGKYVILTFLDTDYEGLTASDVKAQIDMLNNADSGEETTTTEETTEEVDGTGGAVEETTTEEVTE